MDAVDSKMAVKVSFLCPFCGANQRKRRVAAGYVESRPVVFHGEPTCDEFYALEPDLFLVECREKMQGEEARQR